MAPTSTVAALHTRYATKGDPADNGNNHPFVLPGISLVHNGVLRNDDELFAELGVARTAPGHTDSEAIAALLAYGDHDHPTDALERIDGDAAVAWIETDRPRTLHLARVTGRPLAIGFTPGGSAVFASTVEMLRAGAFRAGLRLTRTWDVGPRTYVRLWRGRTQEVERFGGASLLEAWDRTYYDPRDHVADQLRLGAL